MTPRRPWPSAFGVRTPDVSRLVGLSSLWPCAPCTTGAGTGRGGGGAYGLLRALGTPEWRDREPQQPFERLPVEVPLLLRPLVLDLRVEALPAHVELRLRALVLRQKGLRPRLVEQQLLLDLRPAPAALQSSVRPPASRRRVRERPFRRRGWGRRRVARAGVEQTVVGHLTERPVVVRQDHHEVLLPGARPLGQEAWRLHQQLLVRLHRYVPVLDDVVVHARQQVLPHHPRQLPLHHPQWGRRRVWTVRGPRRNAHRAHHRGTGTPKGGLSSVDRDWGVAE